VKWHFTTAELLVMQGRWRDRLRNIYCNKDYMMIRTTSRGGNG